MATESWVMGVALALAANAHAVTICIQTCDVVPGPPNLPEVVGPTVPREPILVDPLPLYVLQPYKEGNFWVYSFSGRGPVTSIEMPVFSDSGLFEIAVPEEWDFSIEVATRYPMTATWHWDSPTDESWQLGFRSIYSPALAAYHFHLVDGTSIATEMYIPWSLQAQRAGYRAFVSSVPEPGMGAMMALGLLVAGVHSRRRRGRSAGA